MMVSDALPGLDAWIERIEDGDGVTGHTTLTIYRPRPAPLADPPDIVLEVEVEVTDGEVDGQGWLQGVGAVTLTDDERGEAVWQVAEAYP